MLGPALLTATVVLATAGCGGTDPAAAASRESASPTTTVTAGATAPAQVLTVDQMAAFVGCVPEPMVKAADFRQSRCETATNKLVLLDFDTTEGQRAWLDTAQLYGGTYLVGDRWALSADTVEYMETLRTEFGGTIEGR